MTTFSVMKTRIVDETLRDDLTSTQLANAINDAIRKWEGERLAFNEKRHTILTVASQEYYDLISPTLLTSAGAAVGTGEAVLEIDSITCSVNSQSYTLTPRTQQWFDDNQTGSYQGEPSSYGIFGNQLRIWPIPRAVRTLTLSDLTRLSPTPMSSDGDTNDWLTEGARLICETAKAMLYRRIIRDMEGAEIAMGDAMAEMESLKRKMAAKVYTGRQAAWSL